jgi:hypothetical protein
MIGTAKFNKNRKFVWAANESVALLSEEIAEFWNALAEGNVVDMVDAWADIQFLMEGRLFLFGTAAPKTLDALRKVVEEYETVQSYASDQLDVMCVILDDYKVSRDLRVMALRLVREANNRKALTYNEGLKVDKPADWVAPQEAIMGLLVEAGVPILVHE